MIITRTGRTITATDDVTGRLLRSEECRSIQCAVALEIKLSNDPKFADMWVRDGDPKSPEVKPHGLEREPLGLPADIARRMIKVR